MLTRNKVQKGLEKIAELDEKIEGNIDINEGQDWFTRALNDTKLMVANAADFLNEWVVDSRFLRGISGNIWNDRRTQADHERERLAKERDQLKQEVEGWMKEMEDYGDDVVSPSSGGSPGTGSTGSGKNSNAKEEKEHREKLKEIEAGIKDLDRRSLRQEPGLAGREMERAR